MASDLVEVDFDVLNDFGTPIAMLWVHHRTSDPTAPLQAWFARDIAVGSTSPIWRLHLVPGTSDYFTIFWTDMENNLFGTPRDFPAEAKVAGGPVEAQIQGSGVNSGTVQILQAGVGLLGQVQYIGYIVGLSGASAAVAGDPRAAAPQS